MTSLHSTPLSLVTPPTCCHRQFLKPKKNKCRVRRDHQPILWLFQKAHLLHHPSICLHHPDRQPTSSHQSDHLLLLPVLLGHH